MWERKDALMRLAGKKTSLTHWRFLVDTWRRGRRGSRPSCCGSTPWKGRTSATALIRQAQDRDPIPGRPTPGLASISQPDQLSNLPPGQHTRSGYRSLPGQPSRSDQVISKFTGWFHYLASGQHTILGPWFTTWPAHKFRSWIHYLARPQVQILDSLPGQLTSSGSRLTTWPAHTFGAGQLSLPGQPPLRTVSGLTISPDLKCQASPAFLIQVSNQQVHWMVPLPVASTQV